MERADHSLNPRTEIRLVLYSSTTKHFFPAPIKQDMDKQRIELAAGPVKSSSTHKHTINNRHSYVCHNDTKFVPQSSSELLTSPRLFEN